MIFNTPTTKDEMYDTLKQIFYFYRIRREGWENMELKPLELDPMTFEEKSNEELLSLAEKEVSVQKVKDILALKTSLKTDIAVKTALVLKKQALLIDATNSVEKSYAKVIADYTEWANKRGMGTSDIVVKQLNDYRLQKDGEISTVTAKYNAEIEGLQGELTLLNERLEQADDYFNDVYEQAKAVKLEELKAGQDNVKREVFKYNNALSEKIQRYDNTILEAKANMEVKYLQIDENLISKDQLIERGYYNDVINCVCGYYDTLTPINAYNDLLGESTLSIYLDEYYQNVVYVFKCKAEDS